LRTGLSLGLDILSSAKGKVLALRPGEARILASRPDEAKILSLMLIEEG